MLGGRYQGLQKVREDGLEKDARSALTEGELHLLCVKNGKVESVLSDKPVHFMSGS